MKRKKYRFGLIISCIILILLLAVPFILNSGDEGNGLNAESIVEPTRHPILSEPLLTKEEFLDRISEHSDVLEVSTEDFENVNVDAFIEKERMSQSNFEWFITEGGTSMKDRLNYFKSPLLTREQFLLLIQEHNHILDVTPGDFEGVDVDDFIEKQDINEIHLFWYITGERADFRKLLNTYVSRLESELLDSYQGQELIVVESTDEEFQDFKNRYFENIGISPIYLTGHHATQNNHDESERLKSEGKTPVFITQSDYYVNSAHGNIKSDEFDFLFSMGRTMDIDKSRDVLENPLVFYDSGGLMGQSSTIPIYLSRSGKYYISGYPSKSEPIKIFCEMDD